MTCSMLWDRQRAQQFYIDTKVLINERLLQPMQTEQQPYFSQEQV